MKDYRRKEVVQLIVVNLGPRRWLAASGLLDHLVNPNQTPG